MNPIYIAHYPHEGCDCYKIDLPWTKYWRSTVVLCPVSEGVERARLIAVGVIQEHLREAMQEPVEGGAEQ